MKIRESGLSYHLLIYHNCAKHLGIRKLRLVKRYTMMILIANHFKLWKSPMYTALLLKKVLWNFGNNFVKCQPILKIMLLLEMR